MSSFMDFNEDGKVDSGEEFIGYQIYKDMTKEGGEQHHKVKYNGHLGWYEIFMIVLFAYVLLSGIADIIYQ